MTKEELKQEAEEYVKQNYCEMCVMADDCKSGCIDCFTVQAYLASAEPREKRIVELEKENAELKSECRRCVYTDSPCILSDYGKDKNGICDHFKDVFDENAELDCQKNRNKYCYSCANATEKCFKNEIGCPCDNYKSYKDENEELRNNGFTVSAMTEQQLKVALEKGEQLEKENAELKETVEHYRKEREFFIGEVEK
jgi:hypothetical protein